MSFRGSGVLGLLNFTCCGLDPFVGFCGNIFTFNIRKYLNQMRDQLQKYLAISVFERKFVHLGTACF